MVPISFITDILSLFNDDNGDDYDYDDFSDDDWNDFNDDGFRLHFPVYVSYCAAQPAMDRRLKQLRY